MPLRLRVLPRADRKADEGSDPAKERASERIVEFEDDLDEIRIGRRADVELSLPFKALSGLHARLLRKRTTSGGRGSSWFIEDLESKNGTYVGKHRLRQGEQRLMFAGDILDLGPVKVMFDGHAAPTAGAEGTATIARRLVNDLLLASPETSAPTVSVISGTSDVETLKLLDRDRPYFIGRGKTCDLRFDLEELSRQHASLTRTWNGVVLRDQGSKNGILVNGIVVKAQRLTDGDEIEMGPLKLRLMDPEERYLKSLEGPDRADRAPRGEEGPKPVVVMPAALAVSLPPTASPPAAAPPLDPGSGPATPRKVSRLAPRPAPPGPGPATTSSHRGPVRSELDEHHPAISARRPPPDPHGPGAEEDQILVRRARRSMFIAIAVLAAIAAVAVVLVLTNWNPSEGF